MKAIILAGGLGTRLRPLTDTTPKPLLPVAGKPIMQHAIENLAAHGIKDIVLAVSFHADKIKDYFGDGSALGVKISYSLEEKPLGTGGAVKQAHDGSNEAFLLVWGDNLANFDWNKMLAEHKKNKAKLTMSLTKREDVEFFGVAELDNAKIVRFVEKPTRKEAPSNWINAGAFVIEPEILNILPEGKSNIERECFENVVKDGKVYGHKHTGYWYATDTLEKYKDAQKGFEK